MPGLVTIGDLNADGKPDLVVANYSDSNVLVLLGNGNGTFKAAVNYPCPYASDSVAIGDVNSDGKPDVVVVSFAGPVSVLLGNGNGTLQAAVNYAAGTGPSSVAIGDLNGDGKSDLIVTNRSDNNVSVLLGNGNGTFGLPPITPQGPKPTRLRSVT